MVITKNFFKQLEGKNMQCDMKTVHATTTTAKARASLAFVVESVVCAFLLDEERLIP